MSNIMDVAKRANVSKATVSRYINNKPVNNANQERIKAAIEELNFSPNKIAQGLSKKKSNLIGVIVPDLLNPFFSEIINEIEKIATDDNLNCLILSSQNKPELEKDALRVCKDFRVAGIILITCDNGIDLSDYTLPIVALDREIKTCKKNVLVDNILVGKMICEYFDSMDAKKILFIEGDVNIDTTIKRRHGFADYANKKKLSYKIISSSYGSVTKVYDDISKISDIDKYDGVFMGNEIIAFALLKEILNDRLIKATIDGTYLNDFLLDSIYTFKQPIKQLAAIAYDRLLNWDECEETILLEIKGE